MRRLRATPFLAIIVFLLNCFVHENAATLHQPPTQLSQELRKLSIEGLGVSEMQGHFDRLTFNKIQLDGNKILQDLATRLAIKFKEKVDIVRKLKTAVEASYAGLDTVRSRPLCCKADPSKYDSRFRTKVDLNQICARISGAGTQSPRYLQNNVLRVMQDNMLRYPTIKWQFFGSEEGMYTNYPLLKTSGSCTSYDPRYRPWYVEAASRPKDVVLVIDYSGSMRGNRLHIAREAAKTVLDTLNNRDRVAVIAFNHEIIEWKTKKYDDCFKSQLADASPVNTKILKSYVDNEDAGGGTSYISAFNGAFNILDVYYKQSNTRQPVILFMTDGQPHGETEQAILNTVANRNKALATKASILTFGIGDTRSFAGILKKLATQTSKEANAEGLYTPVPDTSKLRNKMATYYKSFSAKGVEDKATISIPYVDALGLGLVTSIAFPCLHRGKFIGVVGTDITMSDLLADVTYFNQGQASYAFVADSSGRTMMHPLLPKPSDVNQAPFFVDIRDLEPEGNFSTIVFQGITSGGSGSTRMTSSRFLPRGGNIYEGVTEKEIPSTYFWRSIQETNFTLGVVVKDDDHYFTTSAINRPAGFKFVYHRLDLNRPGSPCQYFGRFAVKDKAVVKFGPQAFKNPYEYLGIEETNETVKGYANYFEGLTDTNTKFKDTTRNTVYATNKAEKIWLQSKTSLSQYVVWRYIGTRDGVFRMIPGASLSKNYDHTARPWYLSAVSNIGKTTVTTPYVDAAGAGLIITAAHTIYKGSGDNQHTTADDVMAVMGADFPLTYFRKVLTDKYKLCKSSRYSCFVMDRSGFLIYHDSFMSPQIKAVDLQLAHITEKEKQVAQHMVQKGLLVRRQCRDFARIKTVKYVDVKVAKGVDHTVSLLGCTVSYNIHPITGSNAFLGIVEKSGSCRSSSGCICSNDKKERPCGLNSICECPCSSPLPFRYCENDFPLSNVSICAVPVQALLSSQDKEPCVEKDLTKCFDAKCSKKTTKETCEGLVGCSWCVKNKDDLSLSKPYCSQISTCFGGKEGTKAPGSSAGNICPKKSKEGLSSGEIAGIVIAVVVTIGVIIAVIIACCKMKNARKPEVARSMDHNQPAVGFKPSQPTAAPMHHGAQPPSAPPQPYSDPYPSNNPPLYPAYNPQYNLAAGPPEQYNAGYH